MKTVTRFLISSLALLAITRSRAGTDAPRPNIVYFYADDMGWGNIRANQRISAAQGVDITEISKIIMPNIDALVDGGINFTHSYGQTVCSPARSCQQTGFHQGHTWADRNDRNDHKAMRTQDPTLGKLLAAAGYRNGMYGKWGYGASQDADHPVIVNPQTLPIAHGYHDCVVELHHVRAHTFLQPSLWYSHVSRDGSVNLDTSLRMNKEVFPGVDLYADNYYAAGAKKFIRAEANGPSPFFAQVSFQLPHAPFEDIETVPGWFDDYKNVNTASWSGDAKRFAAMVTLMDKRIGEIIAVLKDPNDDGDEADSVMKNTLIIFSSDNGGTDHPLAAFFNWNGILRGAKGDVSEGGIRDPLAFYWQGTIKPGQSSDQVTCVTDILPTFCELAGIAPPVGLDGTSIAPLLSGQGTMRKRPYFCYEGQRNGSWEWSIVRDNMKLGREPKSGGLHLYDLKADEAEANDLALDPKYKQVVAELLAIALAENLEADEVYANVFPTWVGSDGADVNAAGSWKETGEWTFARKWPQSKTPSENWNARVVNSTNVAQAVHLDTSINTLGFEVTGNLAAKAIMELTLKSGITLVGRNEIRLGAYSLLNLNGGTLSSVRWIDIFEHATLQGTGSINTTLYNSGVLQTKGLVVSGNFIQTGKGHLVVTVGTHTPLTVDGTVELGGVLKCDPTTGTGQRFTILRGASIKGTFSNPDGLVRLGGQAFRIEYKANSVELERVGG